MQDVANCKLLHIDACVVAAGGDGIYDALAFGDFGQEGAAVANVVVAPAVGGGEEGVSEVGGVTKARAAAAEGWGGSAGRKFGPLTRVSKPRRGSGWRARNLRRKEWSAMTRRKAGQAAEARPRSAGSGRRIRISARMWSVRFSTGTRASTSWGFRRVGEAIADRADGMGNGDWPLWNPTAAESEGLKILVHLLELGLRDPC